MNIQEDITKQLARTKALADDAVAKHKAVQAAKEQAAKEARMSKHYTEDEIAQRVAVVDAWQKSKWFPKDLLDMPANHTALAQALESVSVLSIASVDDTVCRMRQDRTLKFESDLEPKVVEKIVYRDKVKTDAQLKKEKSDQLERMGIRTPRKSEFDLLDEKAEVEKKATVMSQEEKNSRSAAHWYRETQQLEQLIEGYRYGRSSAVEAYRKNILRQIEAFDEDHFPLIPVILKLVNEQINRFSDSQEEHTRAVAESSKAAVLKRARTVRGW
jgi:hypothetical protein